MKKIRLIVAIAAALCLSFVLAGCGGGAASNDTRTDFIWFDAEAPPGIA